LAESIIAFEFDLKSILHYYFDTWILEGYQLNNWTE
jgi:hypothetical protein